MGCRSSRPQQHKSSRGGCFSLSCTNVHVHHAHKTSKIVVTHAPASQSAEEKVAEPYHPHHTHHPHIPHHAKNGADITRALSKPDIAPHDEDDVGDMPTRMNEKQYWWDLNGSVKNGSWKEFHISSVVGKKFSGGMHTVSSHPKKTKTAKSGW